MARGVVCPHCSSELEGTVNLSEVIECPECHKQFDVTKQTISAFERANPSTFQQLRTWITPVLGLMLIIMFVFVSCSEKPKPNTTVNNLPSSIPTSQTKEEYKQHLANSVAADKIAEYEIAKGNGDKMKACVLAGIINQAFLTAKDEEHYGIWRGVEKDRCAEAGVPIKE